MVATSLANVDIPSTAGASSEHGGRIQVIYPNNMEPAFAPAWIGGADGVMWVTNPEFGDMVEVRARTGAVISIPKPPLEGQGSFAVAGNDLWTYGTADLIAVNGASGAIVRSLPESPEDIGDLTSMGVSGNVLWASNLFEHEFIEFNLTTGAVLHTIPFDPVSIVNLTVGAGHVWTWVQSTRTLSEYSEGSGVRLHSVHLVPTSQTWLPDELAVIGTTIWVPMGSRVYIVSAATGKLLRTLVGKPYGLDGASWVASSGSIAWIVNTPGKSVTAVNVKTYAELKIFKGAAYAFTGPAYETVYDRKLWVLSAPIGTDHIEGSITDFPASA